MLTSTTLPLPSPCHIGFLDCLGYALSVTAKQVVGPIDIYNIYFSATMGD